jgi:hypothetical protein
MAAIGEGLSRQREVCGVALAELAGAATIHPRDPDTMEAGPMTLLPARFLALGPVELLIGRLGVDEEETYNHFAHETWAAWPEGLGDPATPVAAAASRGARPRCYLVRSPVLLAASVITGAVLVPAASAKRLEQTLSTEVACTLL